MRHLDLRDVNNKSGSTVYYFTVHEELIHEDDADDQVKAVLRVIANKDVDQRQVREFVIKHLDRRL